MKSISILMTGTGGPGASGYIYSLKNNGEREIRIVGTDVIPEIDPTTLSCLDAFYVIPRANTEPYRLKLLELCQVEHIDVILPLNTIELAFLSSHREEFLKIGTRICVLSGEQLEVVNNKAVLLNKLRTLGIETPDFFVVRTIEDFKRAASELGYPNKAIVVKRPDGNGSRGMRFIDPSISRVDLFLNKKPHSTYVGYEDMLGLLPAVFEKTALIVMEMLQGQEYSVDVLVDHGKVESAVCRRVDLIDDSNDADATIEQKDDVLRYCEQICEVLQIDGLIGFGIKRNDNAQPRILEINPRLQATTILSVVGGVNFPYFAVKKALGEQLRIPRPVEGIRVLQRKQRVFFTDNGSILMKL